MKRKLILLSIIISLVYSDLWAQAVLFPVRENNLWGFIDAEGKWAIDPGFEDVKEFTEGLAAAKISNKWGFIKYNGEWHIEPQFENAAPFNEGVAAVVSKNRWGFIGHNGEFVIDPVFHKASSFSEGLALVSNGNGYIFITHEGYQAGSKSFTMALPFAEGLAPIVSNREKSYMDNTGNITIKHQFDVAAPFSEGLAQVRKNGRWGFIDRTGNLVIPLEYVSTTHFSEGLAAVVKKKKWGFIDKSGSWVIKDDFEFATPFHFGYAVVKSKGKYGVINKQSEWVIPPVFDAMGLAGRSVSLKEELIQKIRKSFNEWAMKGEFEKTEDYIERMGPENQKQVMDQISQRIIKDYGDQVIAYDKAELGYYNADLEQFNVYIPGTLPTSIKVPINEALWFKENWRDGSFQKAEYMLGGENLIIGGYTFILKGREYSYTLDQDHGYLYSYASISWEEEILIPEISWDIRSGDKVVNAIPGSSDVDKDIPVSKYLNKNIFALIIGNEDYKSFQAGLTDEIDVSYAAVDAEIFSKYANKTLGIPKENITLIRNGTAGQIKQALAKMNAIAEAYEGEAEIIFYYAGHGLPDEVSGKPHLIPVDVTGSDLSFAIGLDEALNILTEHKHRRVTVFLDACFSGGGRNENLIASRGVKIKPKSPFVKGNLIMYTASSGNQSAFAYHEKAHGMFTYFLLKALKESKGNITYGQLSHYLTDNVRKSSIIYNNKEQNPETMVSPSIEDVWEKLRVNREYNLEPKNGSITP